MNQFVFGVAAILLGSFSVQAQTLSKDNLVPAKANMTPVKLDGKDVIKVVMDPSEKLFDEPTYVKLKDENFKDGTIEVQLLSKFLPNAPEWARGFIGVTFRINNDNTKFEGFYLRPDNGRTNDQVRRNHTVQYFSYPDFKFDQLRKVAPEKYESYADITMNTWIKMKIVVKGQDARLYLNDNQQPTLIVKDLKHGADSIGSIGLWSGPGTEGYFTDLKITK